MTSPTPHPIVLITGANTGLGLATARALYTSRTTYTILLGTRTPSNGATAITALQTAHPTSPSTLVPLQIDLCSDASIHAAAAHVQTTYARLDILINNAGANLDLLAPTTGLSVRDLWSRTWDVNVAGTHVVTEAFAPLLLCSADPRLVFISSGTACLAETLVTEGPVLGRLNAAPEKGWPKWEGNSSAYRASKAGLNMVMREWARILRADGVKVWGVSPGMLATGLAGVGAEVLRGFGATEPEVGGEFVRGVVEGERDGDVGYVIRKKGRQEW